MENVNVINLSHKQFLEANRNYEKTAIAAKLHYVNVNEPGICRIKKGKGFYYVYEGKTVKERDQIDRIQKLAIPPAWENVWICKLENGHIQATGFDIRKRKQYRYHAFWSFFRNETKFHHLYEFGKVLPQLRLRMEKDLSTKELTQDKVLAAVLSLMERTYIRIGNYGYEKMNGSYGITTMKNKHVEIEGDKIFFSFKGKKGIYHNITLKNKKLARIVKECRDMPGKELFQFYDTEGNRKSIDSGMVNNYLQESTGMDFTAKDFRTWAGSLHALHALRSIGQALTETEKKKNVVSMLDMVSEKLGNTRTVCRKYYVHPGLIKLYEENKLNDMDNFEEKDGKSGLAPEEGMLMHVLKSS